MGLKNSQGLIDDVKDVVTFAVNEQCAYFGECYLYNNFLASGKPVYHIEYPDLPPNSTVRTHDCEPTPSILPSGLSTVMKSMDLDGRVYYCDGSFDTTETKPGDPNVPPPHPKSTVRPSSTRTSSTQRPTSTKGTSTSTRSSTTTKPPSSVSTFSTRTTSTAAPSQSGNPNGCQAKHWDQCAGKNWNGCTVCAVRITYLTLLYQQLTANANKLKSPYQCKFSNDYYSQCL